MNKKKILINIYKNLYRTFGPQYWWPTISKNKEIEIIIGAILTQNTSWSNVEKAIRNLDKLNLLRKEVIKQLTEEELANLIKPSGYFKQKAKKLKKVAEFLESGKEITRGNLLNIGGIGQETADSILLYAYNKPYFVIDSYTKRIMSRLGFCKENISYRDLQLFFVNNLPENISIYKEYHALLVKHAKEHCKAKKPLCSNCQLNKNCEFLKQ